MSVDVPLDRFRAEAARIGEPTFVLTVRDGSRPHVVAAEVRFDGDDLLARVGRRTAANAMAAPSVAVLWPGPDGDGFSLIVDGTAEVDAGDDTDAGGEGGLLRIRPSKAVLHRSRAAVDPGASGSDCVVLG